MTSSVISNTIGARNPYAVAELKLGKKINWKTKSPADKVKLMEKAFGRPYHELFDPKFNSPLFPKKKPQNSSTTSSSLLTGEGSCESCNAVWKADPNYAFFKPDAASKSVNDPVQGSHLANCYYIAALTSVVWVTPDLIKKTRGTAAGEDSFSHYSVPANPAEKISLNEELPWVQTDQLCYSRSNKSNETWPSLYEKAYAAWIGKKHGLINLNRPDYTIICQGDPFSSLEHITGKSSAKTVWKTTDFTTGKAIFEKIQSNNVDATALKTKFPAVACTYPSSTLAPVPAINDTYYTVQYNSEQLVASHSYSLLGIHSENGKYYIVLRNPYGISDPVSIIEPFLDKNGNKSRYDPLFATGDWGPLKNIGKQLKDPDGIFALDADVFRTHFYKFGWVV